MIRRLLFLALLVACVGLASSAFGRAGGGHSFSGGSSHSSSHSSGGWHSSGSSSSGWTSSGGGVPVGDLPLSCILAIVILVIVLIVVVPKQQNARAARATSRAIEDELARRRALNQQTPDQIQENLGRIVERDPAFTPEAFSAHAEKLFVDLQRAWSMGSFDVVRRGMSDGVLRRFTVQVALNRLWGTRNVTADVQVLGAEIAGVESDDDLDTVHVRFEASARDCDVPVETPDAEAFSRAAHAPPSQFVEYWSFVRRLHPGPSAGKLSEGKCPSCGAPVPREATVTCDYCKAILNSGTYDWVLAEITQEDEFELSPSRSVEGFARLKASDSAVNRQVLEDRAALVFWKWIEAQATGEPKRFARLCTPAALNNLAAQQGTRCESFSKTAVGSIDLALIESDAEHDRAMFELRWSTTGAGTGLVRTSVLTLARRSGIKTHAKTGMSTDRCHTCAAIQTEADAVECSHCGALLSQDWAFEELASIDAFRARRTSSSDSSLDFTAQIGAIADPWERQRALASMVAMARADGVVTEKELKLLQQCARRWAIPSAQLDGMLAAPESDLAQLAPQGVEEARALFRGLVAAALVDGRIDPHERALLRAMADHLRIPTKEALAILREGKETAARMPQS